MMNYFEVRERLENLDQFHNLYREYLDFTNRFNNLPAQMVRQRMEPLVPLAVDSLRRIGMGAMVTREAPTKGGRKIRVNLIKAIFRERIIRHFSLDERAPLRLLEKSVIAYKRQLWIQRVQLFNPIFWLFHFFTFLAWLPILIFRKAGYDTSHAEKLTSVRLYVIIIQVAGFYLLAEWIGLLSWVWSTLLDWQ